MLVLGRRLNETVRIMHGEETMLVYVTEVRGHLVRLGFEGPRSFVVERGELETQPKAKPQQSKKR